MIKKPDAYLDENLWSCAHGAGRKLSRTNNLKFYNYDTYKKTKMLKYLEDYNRCCIFTM